MTDGPLIVQSDKTLLLEVDHELAAECRLAIAPFAELERAPEHVHTYRLTPLGLWNARAAGHDAEQVVDTLLKYQPLRRPARAARRRGRDDGPVRTAAAAATTRRTAWCWQSTDRAVLEEVLRSKKVAPLVGIRVDPDTVAVHPSERGHLKQVLLKLGWPAEDLAGYVDGEAHADRPGRGRLDAAHLPAGGRRTTSGPAGPASSCCPAGPARRSSGPRRWPGPRPPR